MEFPRLHISSVQAQTGIRQQRPPMSIQQPNADLHINQDLSGTLHISTTASRLFIDQSEAFADADLKGPLRRVKEYGAQSQQKVRQYVAKVTREGEQLKKIEHGTNALASIAKQNGERPPKDYNYGVVPEHMGKVTFKYQPSDLSIQSDWADPDIRITPNKPDISIPRWETEVYLQQKNNIQFSVTGGSVNRQL
ncbi:DUF6470 family protein [Salipaludibacillus aurantiacus]|uniref:YviE n=1 Tax=Salipaludibacillus aurantiacus TaxID=1601833 RepID=A0A1H9W8G6_9BACI|nr:DUF6470 family protein [Salipaludibacillus aurantiacus]SES30230.1 hypothetical protein SAMN05518684_11532 [Salipaludibacillus aurantiacus]